MKINKRTLFLIVGGLLMLIGFIQFRMPHYRRDEAGMTMLLVAGFVIALFGHPRGPMGFLRDRFDGWGKSLPEQIRTVEFHGNTSVDPRSIIDAAMNAATQVSEAGSTVRVEDTQGKVMNLSIRGIGGIVTQMSFTISWTTGASGGPDVKITVGQFLTRRPTIYWVIPIGRKRIVALPAMRRFHDEFVRQLKVLQEASGTLNMTKPPEQVHRSPEPVAGMRPDYSSPVPPLPDHAPAASESPREAASTFAATSAAPEAFLSAGETDLHLPQIHAEKGAVSDAADIAGESSEADLVTGNGNGQYDSEGEQKPHSGPAPISSPPPSRTSRKARAITVAGSAVALVVLGIFLGTGLRQSGSPNQPGQLATEPTPQPAVVPAQRVPTQTVTPSATTALPSTPPQPVSPTTAAQPGDLGLASPLRPVTCTGKFAVFYHSSIDPSAYPRDVQANLASHPGSAYLLTLGSCSSLNQMSNAGTMIYAVYEGPFDTLAEACLAASRFPDQAYVKVLDNVTPPDQSARPCS